MSDYTKTKPEQSLELFCPECDMPVYQCDGCKEYFTPDTDMYCDETAINGCHFCESCMKNEANPTSKGE